MSVLIAKRYVKALLEGKDTDTAVVISNELSQIASAFNDEKFLNILGSIEVATKDKEELVLSFVEKCSDTTKNLIKLLGSNNRLNIIDTISKELEKEIADITNTYNGIVYTNNELSNDYITSLEEKFSTKLGVSLNLAQNICDYNGIKVDIEGLGVEIGISKDRLKSQMKDHILKAV